MSVYRNINSTSNLHPPALKLSPVHILFNCLLHDLTVFNFTPKKMIRTLELQNIRVEWYKNNIKVERIFLMYM